MADPNDFSQNEIIENLRDETQPIKPQHLHFFSDITSNDLELVKKVWPDLSQERKASLIRNLEKLMEVDTLVSCDDFAFFALEDQDPIVKSQAIHLLWECVDLKLADRFLQILRDDTDPELTASAASGLGKFVLLGELEEIPETQARNILNTLIEKYLTSDKALVRQRILESLGYSDNAQINGFIADAIKQPQKEWVLAALFAISRSANEKWSKIVLEKLNDLDPDVQMEAIKAAGELEIASAKETIIEILENSDPEEDIHLQAIWSLSMIGGNDVHKLFDKLLEMNESEEEADMLETALDNLELTSGFEEIDLFEDEDEEEEY